MLNLLRRAARGFVPLTVDANWRASDDIIWIDLVDPTPDEEAAVEAAYGIDLPTREEARHLEPSSRLYQEAGATFLTATLLARAEEPHPVASPVTLVLVNDVLITIRYEPLKAFTIFAERCAHAPVADGGEAALELLDAIVERSAEVLERSRARFTRPLSRSSTVRRATPSGPCSATWPGLSRSRLWPARAWCRLAVFPASRPWPPSSRRMRAAAAI